MAVPAYLLNVSRNLFFTGKGGVGKTSIACASAISLADRGQRVLLVSTDPASNLDEVLGMVLGNSPTSIPAVPRLSALNLNPEQAAHDYRERVVGPYRGVLPDSVVTRMEEQLSGACTMEIAAFEEFSRLLATPSTTTDFDHIIFDTAPTGHTLRLLSLPAAWTSFIDTNTSGASCLGPLSGLQQQRELFGEAVQVLSDSDRTTLVLVTRPEPAALAEAARSSAELVALGIRNQHLVVNAVFRARCPDDPIATAMEQLGEQALASMPATLAGLERSSIPLLPRNMLGVAALRAMFSTEVPETIDESPGPNASTPEPISLAQLVDDLALQGCGVVLVMGKGGGGKTTIAAAIARKLARHGHAVHLTTTDPAAHVREAVGHVPAGLTVGRIDPNLESQRYREEVLAATAMQLDESGRAYLEEDLRSPCTEEIAVFRAFAKVVEQGKEQIVVLDTAHTGHTILLLDAALAYHRELSRQTSGVPESVRDLLPRLRDPNFTRILLVTLPESTPVHEAAQLQADLLRAQIHPFAWIINQSLTPLTVTDPVLRSRQRQERTYIDEVVQRHAIRTAAVPWRKDGMRSESDPLNPR